MTRAFRIESLNISSTISFFGQSFVWELYLVRIYPASIFLMIITEALPLLQGHYVSADVRIAHAMCLLCIHEDPITRMLSFVTPPSIYTPWTFWATVCELIIPTV